MYLPTREEKIMEVLNSWADPGRSSDKSEKLCETPYKQYGPVIIATDNSGNTFFGIDFVIETGDVGTTCSQSPLVVGDTAFVSISGGMASLTGSYTVSGDQRTPGLEIAPSGAVSTILDPTTGSFDAGFGITVPSGYLAPTMDAKNQGGQVFPEFNIPIVEDVNKAAEAFDTMLDYASDAGSSLFEFMRQHPPRRSYPIPRFP
jgi:hypothetical protein